MMPYSRCLVLIVAAWLCGAPPGQAGQGRSRSHLDLDLSRLTDKPLPEFRATLVAPVLIAGVRYHRVAAGETGIAIARAYGIPWTNFVAINGLTEPFVLHVGQALRLPASTDPLAVLRRRQSPLRLDIDDIVTGGQTAVTVAPPPIRIDHMPMRFIWPVTGRVAEQFGARGGGQVNQGIDIATTGGAGIRAAASGTVAYVGTGVPGYGGLILLRHNAGWISAYGRVASASVAKGDVVKAGQTVGRSSDGPLHFELRRARVPVDPIKYLPAR